MEFEWDPDAELLDAEWFCTAELVVPTAEKTRINIRLDEDIVDYFKEQRRGVGGRRPGEIATGHPPC